MKIWFINHYAITPEQSGGTRHYSLAKELIKLGHQVTIIASNFDHFSGKFRHPGESPVTENYEGVEFVWLPTRSYQGNSRGRAANMYDFWRQVKQIMRIGLSRPDIILGSSPHLFTPAAAQKIARSLNVPFVLEIRDVWPQTLVDLGNFKESSLLIRYLARLERKLYQSADHIITLLPLAGDHCQNLGARKDAITWVPNGIDLSLTGQAKTTPSDQEFTVMFAGAHGLANGLDTVVRAAKIVEKDGIKVKLLGDGPEKAGLKTLAHDQGVSNIEFLDPVPKAEVHAMLQTADAYVMCLRSSDVFRWGISPNKLFDYMAAGKPVIFAVNSSNSPVDDAKCGIRIEPDDPSAMAEAFVRLRSASPDDRQAMGVRGRQYVEENHSFDRLAQRLEGVFLKLIKS